MINKLLLNQGKYVIICIILILGGVMAYSNPLSYHVYNTSIKFYDDKINKTECLEMMGNIPMVYYKDMRYIKIYYSTNGKTVGKYWWLYSTIETFDNCDQDTIIHELAHHCQYARGDTDSMGKKHIGHFDECYWEIWGTVA